MSVSRIDEYNTPEVFAQAVKMIRRGQRHPKPIVLLEGDSDVRLYRWAIRERAELLRGKGKQYVLKTLAALLRIDTEDKWYFVILDADFDRILGVTHPPHVLLTDHHDIECEYLRSDALLKVLDEYGIETRCEAAFGAKLSVDRHVVAEKVRSAVLEMCRVIGMLRLISMRKEYGLKFKDIDFRKVFKPGTVEICTSSLVRVVLAGGAAQSIDPIELEGELRESLDEVHDAWQLCQGHDLVKVFCIGIRRSWGERNINEEELERILRLAYEAEFFWLTSLGIELDRRLSALGA